MKCKHCRNNIPKKYVTAKRVDCPNCGHSKVFERKTEVVKPVSKIDEGSDDTDLI